MARTGGYKALVPVTPEVWRDFRALCITEGVTIADAIAGFVTRTVEQARGAGATAPRAPRARRRAAEAEAVEPAAGKSARSKRRGRSS